MTPHQKHQLSITHQVMTVWGIPLIAGLLSVVLWFVVKHYESQERINQQLLDQSQEHEVRLNIHDYILTQKEKQ